MRHEKYLLSQWACTFEIHLPPLNPTCPAYLFIAFIFIFYLCIRHVNLTFICPHHKFTCPLHLGGYSFSPCGVCTSTSYPCSSQMVNACHLQQSEEFSTSQYIFLRHDCTCPNHEKTQNINNLLFRVANSLFF